MNPFKSFIQYKEVILIGDYTMTGGGSRPIYTYYRYKVNKGHNDVLLLRLALRKSLLKVFLLLFFKKRIIINSLVPFRYWPVHLLCFLQKDVIIYLHEAAPHVEPFRQNAPLRFKMAMKFLGSKKVAFVSEWQKKYFEGLCKLGRTKIVYNALNLPSYTELNGNKINIVTIGFQSQYKNVPFFSKVADSAFEKGLPYQFHWIGGDAGDMNAMYHSPHVNWMGDQEQTMDLLNQFDLFFFPSFGDTFGLVLIEALYKGKKIVSFQENGLAPFLAELKGCRVFTQMNEVAVLNDIAAVLEEDVDLVKNRELVNHLCSVEKLEQRLDAFFLE